jgi:hypothetical protein
MFLEWDKPQAVEGGLSQPMRASSVEIMVGVGSDEVSGGAAAYESSLPGGRGGTRPQYN